MAVAAGPVVAWAASAAPPDAGWSISRADGLPGTIDDLGGTEQRFLLLRDRIYFVPLHQQGRPMADVPKALHRLRQACTRPQFVGQTILFPFRVDRQDLRLDAFRANEP